MTKISIVIPVFNNWRRLQQCLESIAVQRHADTFELIVVDNGSSDESVAIAQKFGAKIFDESEIKSPYIARNRGIREASGDLLVLLDSNCVLSGDNWLQMVMSEFENTLFEVAVPRFQFDFRGVVPTTTEYANSLIFLDSETDAANGGAAGPCLICTREVFDRYGMFPIARSNGDTVWSNHVTRSGGTIKFLGDVICRYPAKSSRAMRRAQLRIGFGNRVIWLGKGHSRGYVLLSALWNARPEKASRLRELVKMRSSGLPQGTSFMRLYLTVWSLRIYRALGRMGFRRVLGLSAD